MKTPLRIMLRQYRLLSQVEQRELARLIGISPSSLSRFEAGHALDEQGTIKLVAWLFRDAAAEPRPSPNQGPLL